MEEAAEARAGAAEAAPEAAVVTADPAVVARGDPVVPVARDDPVDLVARDDPVDLVARDDPVDLVARDVPVVPAADVPTDVAAPSAAAVLVTASADPVAREIGRTVPAVTPIARHLVASRGPRSPRASILTSSTRASVAC